MTATSITFSSSYTVSGGSALVSVTAYMNLSSGSSSAGTYPASWWGYWGNGSNNVYRSFSGSVAIVSWSGWVTLAYGSTTTIGFGASGTNYWGSASGEHYVTLPARPYEIPRAPLSPSAVRVSDTQATASWAANYDGGSGAQPWTGVYIDRWSKSSGTWTRVASVSWNVTSWTDQGISANNQYKYRYASYNPSGQSSWVETSLFATTPSAPQTVVAEKTGGNINVSWVNTAVHQDGAIIYDNGTQIDTVGAGVSTYTHVAPSTAITHQYTIRATTTTPSLQSALSSASNIVQLLTAPNAPTGLASDAVVYAKETSPSPILSWTHNPADSSSQTQMKLRLKSPGASAWTEVVYTQTSSSKSVDLATFGDPSIPTGTYQWGVSTRGAHVDFSPFSATATFEVENAPQITILDPAPAETITTSRIALEWSYSQAQSRAQQSYTITVKDSSDATVHTQTLASAETSAPIDYTLGDGQSYQIRLSVTAANGLSTMSPSTVNISVDYDEPAIPLLYCEFDSANGSNSLQISNPILPVAAVKNRVYRSIDQESEWYGIPSNTPPPAPVTNLFTNPNLVGDGTWAEVRRNLLVNPKPASVSAWSGINGATASFLTDSVQVVCPGTMTQEGVVASTLTRSAETASCAVDVKAPAGTQLYVGIRPNQVTAAQKLTYFTATGEWQRIVAENATGDVSNGHGIHIRTSVATAVTFEIRRAIVEARATVGPYFDGSSPQGSVDPDMRQRWLGTANASESVMEIERVAGLTTLACVAGVSTKAGKPAVRLIPNSPSSNASYAYFGIPTGVRPGGTVIATLHLDTPLTGALNSIATRTVDATETRQGSSQPPNQTGVYPLRATYSNLTSLYRARVWHGGSLGSSDVWWTDIGLFAGSYDGPAFTGNSGSGKTDEGFVYETKWDGAVDNSTSTRTFSYPTFSVDEWELLGELPANTTVSDFEGLTYGRTMYLVEAVSAIPSSAISFISIDADSRYVWIGHGQSFSSTLAIPFDVIIQESTDLANESSYIFDGRDLPVSITGIARSRKLSLSGTLDPLEAEGASWRDVNSMAGAPGIKMYRDHDGRRMYAQISGTKVDRRARDLRRVSMSVEEVEQL